jgi:predicted amidohydrolase YtcJ
VADLAVLSDGDYEVPTNRSARVRSVMAVVDGKIVHDVGVLK